MDESDPSGVWSVTSALGEWKSTDVTMMAGETMMAWTLNGLLADMHYELKVKATNEIGTSPPSDSFIFHTAPGNFISVTLALVLFVSQILSVFAKSLAEEIQ